MLRARDGGGAAATGAVGDLQPTMHAEMRSGCDATALAMAKASRKTNMPGGSLGGRRHADTWGAQEQHSRVAEMMRLSRLCALCLSASCLSTLHA